MNSEDRIRLVELTESVITGMISESDFADLEARLSESAEARELYLSHASMDPMLRWVMADASSEDSEVSEEIADNVVRPNFGRRPVIAGAVAALVAITLVLLQFFSSSNGNQPVVLEMANDVRVELSADAEYIEQNVDGEFVLQSGQATFFVGEKGHGFAVAVPHGRIVDLGTAFSVDIGLEGEATVRVLSGTIEVYGKGSQDRLNAGSSGTLAESGWVVEETVPTKRLTEYQRLISESNPVGQWSFTGSEGAWLADIGSVKLVAGPRPPEHAQFSPDNTAVFFGGSGSVRTPDQGENSDFDFQNGDEITLEAWVRVDSVVDNGNVYIVGKGRTQNLGYQSDNQNFSMRLRGQNGAGCISFLFRSAPNGVSPKSKDENDLFFHRWTSNVGITSGEHWHHVAVTYLYGDPSTVRGYLDGKPLDGEWDMGGPTSNAPVVDDDEIWIGSALGGSSGNTFPGSIDEVAIYRRILSPETLREHASIRELGK